MTLNFIIFKYGNTFKLIIYGAEHSLEKDREMAGA